MRQSERWRERDGQNELELEMARERQVERVRARDRQRDGQNELKLEMERERRVERVKARDGERETGRTS